MRLETTAQVAESDEATRRGGQAPGASSRPHRIEMAPHGTGAVRPWHARLRDVGIESPLRN